MILAGMALALMPLPTRAQVKPKSVLSLFTGERTVTSSSERRLGGSALVDLALERALRTQLGGSLYHYSEHIDTTRVGDTSYAQDVLSLLRSKYEARQLDLIVVGGDTAVAFISQHRASFFPEIPVVFYAVDPVVALPNSTGVLAPMSQRKVLETALRVQPDTRHVAIVAGTTAFDQYYVRAARKEFKPYEGRLAFTYLTGLPMPELVSRVATLPPYSIILFMGLTEDGDGHWFLPQEMLGRISEAANAPTYGWSGAGMDHGLVGGTVYSQEVLGSQVASLGLRVMKGERAETIPVTEIDWSTTQFDWRQLRRWNINESLLPVNSTILFKQPSAWDLYRPYILGGSVILILQTALIVGLVVQRTRRRRTERALRESYEQNQHLAGRLIRAQEDERARIARDLHDDVSQQLAGLSIALSGLKRRAGAMPDGQDLEADAALMQQRATTIARSVRDLSHDLHPEALRHVGLASALTTYCQELSRSSSLAVTCSAEGHFEPIGPDAALGLYRIAQEALHNVIKHANARQATVRLVCTGGTAELTIADDGMGFDSRTSKSGTGIGLVSITERARLLSGTVSIETSVDNGTMVRVRIPIDARPTTDAGGLSGRVAAST